VARVVAGGAHPGLPCGRPATRRRGRRDSAACAAGTTARRADHAPLVFDGGAAPAPWIPGVRRAAAARRSRGSCRQTAGTPGCIDETTRPRWPPGSPAASQAAAQCLGGAPSVPGLCEVWHVREPRRCRARPWRQHQAAPMHGSSGSVCEMKELRDMIEEPQTRLQFSFYRLACARCFGAAAMPGKPPRRVA
jgi:hypothetical protein